MKTYAEAYRAAEVETLSQRDLIVKMYQATERFLLQAQTAMREENHHAAHIGCTKAKNIILELFATLNLEQGGDIAKQLRELYLFFIMRITEANLRKDPALIHDIVPLISTLREGWEQIPAEFANASSMPTANEGHAFNLRT